jgi:1,2-diacylglycerol 3-alpha-glucosyltransferase
MHLVVLFYNIGGYHLARLNAAKRACDERGWSFSALQIAGSTTEHPWGNFELPSYVTTLTDHKTGAQPEKSQCDEAVLNYLNEANPDGVAIPGWGFDFARAALAWCRKKGRTAILMSESKYDDSPRSWWREKLKSYLYVSKFQAAIVGGTKHREYLVRLGMPRNRIFGGYDVVDNNYFFQRATEIRRLGLAAAPEPVRGKRYFLAANRFIQRKNLDNLIRAFEQFATKQQTNDWQLVLLGGGEAESQLRALAANSKCAGQIHFPGFVDYFNIPAWYAFAGAFIHPALSEQWGLVVNEAMASGLPILLSNRCGCHPDLLHEGKNGYSFDPQDVTAMIHAMHQIAGGLPGAGEHSRKIMHEFRPEAFGQGLVAAFESTY